MATFINTGTTPNVSEIKILIETYNAKIDIDISSLNLNEEAIVDIFNRLPDLTGLDSQNIILNISEYDVTTIEDRAIATNKNWNISQI